MIVYGKGGISAELVAHSRWEGAEPVCTLRLVYPRFIHGEVMTHRMFSRNAASSRAIPISAMIERVKNSPAMPIHWGKNRSGMQADGEVTAEQQSEAQKVWFRASMDAVSDAQVLDSLGVHKQVVNRLLEPFMFMHVIVTATRPGLNNFFNLRLHSDAQPEIYELARLMDQAIIHSTPRELRDGEWHMPFVDWFRDGGEGRQVFMDESGAVIPLETARMVSVSACAQVSYRKNDLSVEKARRIYDRLIMADVVHASPFEHVAQAKSPTPGQESNLVGWTQYRKMIPNEFNPKWRN